MGCIDLCLLYKQCECPLSTQGSRASPKFHFPGSEGPLLIKHKLLQRNVSVQSTVALGSSEVEQWPLLAVWSHVGRRTGAWLFAFRSIVDNTNFPLEVSQENCYWIVSVHHLYFPH